MQHKTFLLKRTTIQCDNSTIVSTRTADSKVCTVSEHMPISRNNAVHIKSVRYGIVAIVPAIVEISCIYLVVRNATGTNLETQKRKRRMRFRDDTMGQGRLRKPGDV